MNDKDPLAGVQREIFPRRRETFLEQGGFNKYYICNTRKKDSTGKNVGDFSRKILLKQHFE